jgi:transcriptional regulator with XRE-family HTH domain
MGNKRIMTLKQYLTDNGISLTQFGYNVGVSEHAVRKWIYGQRRPDLEMMLKIEESTSGNVAVADWARVRAA